MALLACSLLFAACERSDAVEILRVTELGPRQAEIGDRVEVAGLHFPRASELRRVTVTLRATLSRAGYGPCGAPVEVTLSDPPDGATQYDPLTNGVREATYAQSTSRSLRLDGPDRLAFVLDEPVYRQLTTCPGERNSPSVSHATLSFGAAHARGAQLGVTVRFEGLSGVQAVEGTLRGATLDVLAPPSRRVLAHESLSRRGQRVLESMGVVLAEAHPTSGGLRVGSVAARSPADRAGIGANDAIVGVDGLSVLSLEDLAVPENTRSVRVLVSRDEVVDERTVVLEGYATASPTDLLVSATSLVVLALVLLLLLTNNQRFSTVLSAALPARAAGEGFVRGLLRSSLSVLRGRHSAESVGSSTIALSPYLLFCAVASTLALAPFVPALLRTGWDVGLLFAIGAALRWLASPTISWRSALRSAPLSMASVTVLGCIVAASGTFRAEGVVAAQGGLPWEWHAFRAPMMVPLLALFFLGICVGVPQDPERNRPALIRASVGAFGTWLAAASGCAALLGGWQVPGAVLSAQDSSASLQIVGAMIYLTKTWIFVGLAVYVQQRVGRERLSSLVDRSARAMLTTSVLCAALTAAYVLVAPRAPLSLLAACSGGTFTFFVLFLLRPWLVTKIAARHAGYAPTVFGRADSSAVAG